MGRKLEKYFTTEQTLQEIFSKLKLQYDILYKEYEIHKNKKSNKWIIAVIVIMIILNIITISIMFTKNWKETQNASTNRDRHNRST